MAVQHKQAFVDFVAILKSLDRKFELIHTKWSGEESRSFEAKLRTQIPHDGEDFNGACDKWVRAFSKGTETVWVNKISSTGAKIRFRKQYQCWPRPNDKVRKELLFDSKRCKATLDVKVLTDDLVTRRKNKHLRDGLNVVVKMNFTHLHPVDTTQPHSWLIHRCEPQAEPPKPVAPVNSEKLSRKIAEIVQKGLSASPMVVNPNPPPPSKKVRERKKPIRKVQRILKIENTAQDTDRPKTPQPTTLQVTPLQVFNGVQYLQQAPSVIDVKTLTIDQLDDKLRVRSIIPDFTEVIVANAPDIGFGNIEPLLVSCEPTTLMFDPTQVIPMATVHAPLHHFVEVRPGHIDQNGQYL